MTEEDHTPRIDGALPALDSDPRFIAGIELLNRGDFFDASELFEELFFEAVRDEVPIVRTFLQLAVGCLHLERRQFRAAEGRLGECLIAMKTVSARHEIDVDALAVAVRALIDDARSGQKSEWPVVVRRAVAGR